MKSKIIESKWHKEIGKLSTTISGDVSAEEVELWQHALKKSLAETESHQSFKALINLYCFKDIDQEVHWKSTEVAPLILTRYGFRVRYVDIFENVSLPLSMERGILCVAVAHVHHDDSKINEYQKRFDKVNEKFFTDPKLAEEWLESIEVIK